MQFFNINNPEQKVSFREAAVTGQAPGRGLYFPERIPVLERPFIERLPQLSREEIGMRVMQPYTGDDIPQAVLADIIRHTVSFDFPLIPVHRRLFALELFHGPTLAFKDVGARFMSRCLGYFSKDNNRRTTVLVATSGDTGGAVANGFAGVEGVEVIILYPAGKVSVVQELQLTTCGGNITALKVNGSFDDCQQLVKQAFADADLQRNYVLTSANSINVARWLPQQLYYFFALQQWVQERPPVIAVPSGNFGNLAAGLLAAASGLPVQHFIAACNANDAVVRYLLTGVYSEQTAVPTYSNAMDVGVPSNFIRIQQLFNNDYGALKRQMSGCSVSDGETLETIARIWKKYHYLAEPHGAVGIHALEQYLLEHVDGKGIFLATAHPVKFPAVIEGQLHIPVPQPGSVSDLYTLTQRCIEMPAGFAALKEWMMSREK